MGVREDGERILGVPVPDPGVLGDGEDLVLGWG